MIPDEVAIEGGHTFNEGDHLTLAEPYRASSSGNEDSNYVGVTFTYKLKPTETRVVNWHEWAPPAALAPIILDHGAHQEPEGSTVEGVIEALQETDTATRDWIALVLILLVVLGAIFYGIKLRVKKSD